MYLGHICGLLWPGSPSCTLGSSDKYPTHIGDSTDGIDGLRLESPRTWDATIGAVGLCVAHL